ncbi:PREDICTED: integrin-alpha FG-GAP repeat-containing protein 2-like [Acropora digitifera]|uniref:integrin-alpha FG-GAP repeat-containing protein 2-like n=1 Tax=Acropora digitifera TaxID=70779 RepID=UPI00077A08BB|nr:PREDICTED: integrin-alpha FG-GAP repeat-containing protein 2-like [Acropora digitifera]
MNSHVRSVSFVENLQLEITESLFNESLLLADVDNDGDYELIVGQFNGDLVIFKGSSHKPWRICHHLGMITCVGAGDLKNNGENVLFCITAEGWCHIFHITASPVEDGFMEPISSQLLPTNCRIFVLVDVDGDGELKLVTGHADRVVHIHQLEAYNEPATPVQDEELQKCFQVALLPTLSLTILGTAGRKERKNSKQEDVKSESQVGDVTNEKDGLQGQTEAKTKLLGWRFVHKNSWTLSYQMNSLVVFDAMNVRHLLASQPGGTYAILMSSVLNKQEKSGEQASSSPSSSIFNQLPVLRARNKGIPTNLITINCHDCASAVVNSSRSAGQNPTYLAICTQDGHLSFINNMKQHWFVRVEPGNYGFFAMSKLDITQDGDEKVALCAWNGNTYIIDHRRNVVQFKFDENVMAFCAGKFAFSPGKNLPALVYVTSSNRVVIYHNVRLTSMVPSKRHILIKREPSQKEKALDTLRVEAVECKVASPPKSFATS